VERGHLGLSQKCGDLGADENSIGRVEDLPRQRARCANIV
jgi:hypothetical protein